MILHYGKKTPGESRNTSLRDSPIREDCDVLKLKNILNLATSYRLKTANAEIFRTEIRINVFKGW